MSTGRETHWRAETVRARVAAAVLQAAGETFAHRALLPHHKGVAAALRRLARAAEQADGGELAEIVGELQAVCALVDEALLNALERETAAQQARLGLGEEEFRARLYDGEHGIFSRQADWDAAGLGTLRGASSVWSRTFLNMVRLVWVSAESRAEIDAFVARLRKIRGV
ncbi:hypothetical protein [Nonomuraea sp. NPDC003214]